MLELYQKDEFVGIIHTVRSKGKFREPKNSNNMHAVDFDIRLRLEGERYVLTNFPSMAIF